MIKKIIGVFLCTLFVSHFSITLLYNSPSNPVQAKNQPVINTYMNPLFEQNWRLFAPDPVTTTTHFHVKAKLGDRETEWIDLINYMVDKNYQNRFTPYNAMLRIPRGAWQLPNYQDDAVREILRKIDRGELEEEGYEDLLENAQQEELQERSIDIINRFAEAHLSSIFPEEDIIEFQVLITEIQPVPFSENGNLDYVLKESHYNLEWVESQGVLPMY
ncbi:DUF5819 family protein [Alteribacter populi]|uniref:DUF5819 family protein n=1 Tax=Alteribacter populi TaxID=2011011 RepID=UPI000BBAFDD3|nr:DUF5819 family protein [Alteribacter populi]